nr:pentatricopeptide repeat-containing protein At3g02650, mitochondrial [Tanacetum cinerariifolium]
MCTLKIKPHNFRRSFFISMYSRSTLHSNRTTLGEAFFRACITEARFEAIVGKELNIKEKVDTILSWPSKEAPLVVKGSLDANEDTILSLRSEDLNLMIQEKEVEYVRALNAAPLEVVFAGHFDIGVDEDGGGEFDDRLDEINLDLSQEFVIKVLEGRDVSSIILIGFLKWVYREKNCEVFSVTSSGRAAALDDGRHKEKATIEKEETIKETMDTLTSLQSEVASLEDKRSLDANEEGGFRNQVKGFGEEEARDVNPIRTLRDYSKPSHEGYMNTIELLEGNNVIPLRSDTIRGKLHDRNAKESWALLEDLALYDNESWRDPRDFSKPVKAISLPQDISSTSDHHPIELEHQVQRLKEAYIAPIQPTQVNKITSSCEICSGPHDTRYCMKNLKQAFVDYAPLHTDEAGVPGRPFVEISNMTHDPPVGVIRFTNRTDEIAYKMPHKIEQYDSLSDVEREHTKSFYLRNEEDKRRGVEYAMSKILRFYKECLELGPEYVTGNADEEEVTKFSKKTKIKILSEAEDDVRIYPDDVVNPAT